MRLLEITYLILIFALLIWSLKRNSAKSIAFSIIAGCTFLVLILHLIIEGWRGQMLPAYVVGVIILAIAVKRKLSNCDLDTQPRSRFRLIPKILFSGAGIFLLLVSDYLSWAFPVYQLPDPTGPYQVGTSQWHLKDKSREEIHTVQPDDYREISVYGWYPANTLNTKKTAELHENPRLYVKALARSNGFSELVGLLIFDQFRLIRTHAYSDAAVSKKRGSFPVLIFSHGYGGDAKVSAALMEELASHGFAVFSIGHTYESMVESFPGGRVIYQSPSSNIEGFLKAQKEAEELKSGDIAAAIELFKNFNTSQANGRSIDIWSADTRFVIDWLDKLNNEESTNPFYRQLDLNRLGVLGHSFGGVTAAQVAFEDNRVKAALSFDGGVPRGEFIDQSLDVPFMFMKAESSTAGLNANRNDALLKANRIVLGHMMERSNNDIYNITVIGSKHGDFSDATISYQKKLGRLGKIDGQKMLIIRNAYTLAFFNKYLKGIDSPLLKGPSPDFPEVIIKTRNQ
jgi:dienelactone hydrolase